MRKNVTVIFIIFCLKISAQEKRILVFDLFKGSVDTIGFTTIDTSIIKEHTDYFVGNMNNDYNLLSNETPTLNTYPGSFFTKKKQASLDYDINKYPIRTSVKLFKLENDTLKSKCSGSIISRKHVLTAGHCVTRMGTNLLLHDSIFVSPVFDNGECSTMFDGSWVSKIYIFENCSFNEDFSILELEKPIGENTGWISIGFDSNDENLLEGIFYKFSYPAISMPEIDSNLYCGDTLYYGYGLASSSFENGIMISNTSGIPGESGSSLIKVENGKFYTSYGVLSYSYGLRHCRLKNWEYFVFKEIIKNDLILKAPEIDFDDDIVVYPNPVKNIIHVRSTELIINAVKIFNIQGQLVKEQTDKTNNMELNISDLPNGILLFSIESNDNKIARKVIKID